jgi:nucleoid DNA-binding protein
MKKRQIAKRLARSSGISHAEAADKLDQVVNEILSHLRSGQPAPLPGLGTFLPGLTWEFEFEKPKRRRK